MARISEPIEESDWVSQEKKKKGNIRICIDLRKLKYACVHDPFPTPFRDETLNNVGGHESYYLWIDSWDTTKLRSHWRIEERLASL